MLKPISNAQDQLIFDALIGLLLSLGYTRDDSKYDPEKMGTPYLIMIRKDGRPDPIYSVYDLMALIGFSHTEVTEKDAQVMEMSMYFQRQLQQNGHSNQAGCNVLKLKRSLDATVLLDYLFSDEE